MIVCSCPLTERELGAWLYARQEQDIAACTRFAVMALCLLRRGDVSDAAELTGLQEMAAP